MIVLCVLIDSDDSSCIFNSMFTVLLYSRSERREKRGMMTMIPNKRYDEICNLTISPPPCQCPSPPSHRSYQIIFFPLPPFVN